ncbi:MAG: hypothetical protein ABSD88_18390 [Candidatus Korobacteraceae bacterium]|jgi:hypothetical protein
MTDEKKKGNPIETKAKLVPASRPRSYFVLYNGPWPSKTETPPEKAPAAFNPDALRKQAEQMIAEGKMPPADKFFKALEKVRQEYAPKVMKARKATDSDEK